MSGLGGLNKSKHGVVMGLVQPREGRVVIDGRFVVFLLLLVVVLGGFADEHSSLANRNYPGRSPLGARFQFGRWGDKGYWYTITGVVKEITEPNADTGSQASALR